MDPTLNPKWGDLKGRFSMPRSTDDLGRVSTDSSEAMVMIEVLHEIEHSIRAVQSLYVAPVFAQSPDGARAEAMLEGAHQLIKHLIER